MHPASSRAAFANCRKVSARHGRTYYLATLLLPAWKRPYVHALYAFARCADELVDNPVADPRAALAAWRAESLAELKSGVSVHPVRAAVVETARRWSIPVSHFADFLDAMAMDLTVTSYATYDDLRTYMHGSAAVIGRQMLPILEPLDASAAAYAEDLGIGFQLTNFVRDVGEDLRRGRVYLPQDDLDHFGVTRASLASGVADARVRRLLAYEVARAREVLRAAEPGIRLLHPASRDCVRTALTLYGGILDEVERAGYDVLDRRVAVGLGRRAYVAGNGLVRARFSQRRAARTSP